MKLYLLKANENWICDQIVEQFERHNPTMTTNNILESDVIWLVASWLWNTIDLQILKSKRVITTVHHIDNDKFNYIEFMARDNITDVYHCYDEITESKLKMITGKPIHRIMYWIDHTIWNPEFANGINIDLPNNKTIIGSFQRDTEGFDLKTPKLSKGPDQFCDYIESLSNVHVLLGGWRRQYVINRLETTGTSYTYIEMADHPILIKMYRSCDLYVVSSRVEGGPQAILEASILKCPIVSTDVGIASTVLNRACVKDVKEFGKPEQYKQYVDYNYDNVKKLDIDNMNQYYINILKGI